LLNGYFPWQLLQLYKFHLLNEHGAFVEYWLAQALITIPENPGNVNHISKFVYVTKALAAVAVQAFSVGNIVRCKVVFWRDSDN
jgi:hypothetical protein